MASSSAARRRAHSSGVRLAGIVRRLLFGVYDPLSRRQYVTVDLDREPCLDSAACVRVGQQFAGGAGCSVVAIRGGSGTLGSLLPDDPLKERHR
jgi:hypothetical protein